MRWYKTILALILCSCLLMTSISPASAWTEYPTGNIDNNESIDASDALLALQHSVHLTDLKGRALTAADVSGDGKINASDALLILQHSVCLIDKFPNDMTGEEKYYSIRDAAYGVTGEDFIDNGEVDLNNTEALLETYATVAEPSDVETARMTDTGELIYTPISDEAQRLGTLNKYNRAEKTTGTLELGGTVLNYSVPKKVTAYDPIPIEYSISSDYEGYTTYVSANTFEDPDRYAENNAAYFDCNLPNNPDLEITYEGYVVGNEVDDYAAVWKSDFNDKQATQYPTYEYGELVRSGTLPAGDDYLWLKFSFKNTGDTILDPEGNGAFRFEPILYKKNNQGKWERIYFISTDNRWERLFDYLYPGESGEVWLHCYGNAEPRSFTYYPGEFRLTMRCYMRNEGASPASREGSGFMDASFDFTVTEDGAMTEPNPIVYTEGKTPVRNSWIASYEEFQSSFDTLYWLFLEPSVSDVMYVQPAPWNDTVTLKIMHGDGNDIAAVHIPIEVESDSLFIELNPYNENYHINEDGTREPLLVTQSMIQMRGTIQMGPDSLGTGVNDLLNMKDAGINMVNTTMSDTYHTTSNWRGNAYKFMMDCVRVLGFDMEGFSHYPYNYDTVVTTANRVNGGAISGKTISSFGHNGMNEGNGVLAKYTFTRYGDIFWINNAGVLPIAAEDTRGQLGQGWRFGIATDSAISQYQAWLQTIYSNITELNAAYGTSYGSFAEVDPREGAKYSATYMGGYTSNGTDAAFQENTRAMAELDLYRNLARISDYKAMFKAADLPNEDNRLWIRYEGAQYLAAGINPNTTNPKYRSDYYAQRINATIPELMAASGIVFGGSNYDDCAADPSEIYELTKHTTLAGLTMSKMYSTVSQAAIVFNHVYGDSKYVAEYNLADTYLKGVTVYTSTALYPYLKAMYEGGGIPGVLWQDYHCDSFVTTTQYKELQFYTQKIQEMLQTEDGREWATNFEAPDRSFAEESKATWTYPQEYIEQVLKETPRSNRFEDGFYTK